MQTDRTLTANERVKRHEVLMMSDLQSGAEKIRYVTDADAASLEAEIERLRKENRELRAVLSIEAKHNCELLSERETAHELPPRIAVMEDGRAMGGSDACHTCEAHCTVINDLETALRGLYWDNVDYLTLNKLGGMQNHWMRAARLALDMDADDVRPSQKAEVGETFPENKNG